MRHILNRIRTGESIYFFSSSEVHISSGQKMCEPEFSRFYWTFVVKTRYWLLATQLPSTGVGPNACNNTRAIGNYRLAFISLEVIQRETKHIKAKLITAFFGWRRKGGIYFLYVPERVKRSTLSSFWSTKGSNHRFLCSVPVRNLWSRQQS